MTGTFIDTICICTLTGLAIVISGAWADPSLEGVEITSAAFRYGLPLPERVSEFILMLCLVFFAFTTIIGWSYYSERCLAYLCGGARMTSAFRISDWNCIRKLLALAPPSTFRCRIFSPESFSIASSTSAV